MEHCSHLTESGDRIRSGLLERPGDFSLATGAAGHALVYGLLGAAFDVPRWTDFARRELERALSEVTARPVDCGLFTGLSGVAFVFEQLHSLGVVSAEPGQFEAIDRFILAHLPYPTSRASIDMISGLAGIGFYMLTRPPAGAAEEAVAEIFDRLAGLLPESDMPPPRMSPFGERNGYRDVDIGIAHGLAGPLAFLNAARDRAPADAELDRRRSSLSRWLSGCMRRPGSAILFPSFVPDSAEGGSGRNAWCYGALGIGIALANSRDDDATDSLFTVLSRLDQTPVELWNLNGPGLCHGYSGAVIFRRFLRERLGERPDIVGEPGMDLLCEFAGEPGLVDGGPGALLAAASLDQPELRSRWLPLFGAWTGA